MITLKKEANITLPPEGIGSLPAYGGDIPPDRAVVAGLCVFWEELDLMSPDELLGLHTWARVEHRMLMLKFAVAESRTMPEQLEGVNRFQDLNDEHAESLMAELMEFAGSITGVSEVERRRIIDDIVLARRSVLPKACLIEEKIRRHGLAGKLWQESIRVT